MGLWLRFKFITCYNLLNKNRFPHVKRCFISNAHSTQFKSSETEMWCVVAFTDDGANGTEESEIIIWTGKSGNDLQRKRWREKYEGNSQQVNCLTTRAANSSRLSLSLSSSRYILFTCVSVCVYVVDIEIHKNITMFCSTKMICWWIICVVVSSRTHEGTKERPVRPRRFSLFSFLSSFIQRFVCFLPFILLVLFSCVMRACVSVCVSEFKWQAKNKSMEMKRKKRKREKTRCKRAMRWKV